MSEILRRDNSCWCILFRRAANTLTKHYDRAFSSLGLSTAQLSLLADIDHLKACNKSELAQCARLDRTTIIRNLDVLKHKGLIAETAGENRRNKRIHLTKAGKASLKEGTSRWARLQGELEKTLGEERLTDLKQLLDSIENLERSDETQ